MLLNSIFENIKFFCNEEERRVFVFLNQHFESLKRFAKSKNLVSCCLIRMDFNFAIFWKISNNNVAYQFFFFQQFVSYFVFDVDHSMTSAFPRVL